LLVFALEDYNTDNAEKHLKHCKSNASVVKHHFNDHDIGLPKQEVAVCEDGEERKQDHHVHLGVHLRFVAAHAHVDASPAEEGKNNKDGNLYKELALWVAELGQLVEKQGECDDDDDAAEILVEV